MQNFIITTSLFLLFSLSISARADYDMKSCMPTIKSVTSEFSFSHSAFVYDYGETNFGDGKDKTLIVKAENNNYTAPKKMEDGTYFQEQVYRSSTIRVYWNDKKELTKLVSSGTGTFDKPFFSKTIEFANKNGTCVPMKYYSGAGENSEKKAEGEEFFNTELCYELQKYLADNSERKKCLDLYVPELLKILDKHQESVTFAKNAFRNNKETQVSVRVYGEMANCTKYKTMGLADNFSLWVPNQPNQTGVITPVEQPKETINN